MSLDSGKKIFKTFSEAERAASQMRSRHAEGFQPYKVDSGWAVGGVHIKAKMPYNRVKSFEEIRTLFSNLSEPSDEAEIDHYEACISSALGQGKSSSKNGGNDNWVLQSWSIKKGHQLDMKNDNDYLVLSLRNERESLEIFMGGAFSPSTPLISKQAASLTGKSIIWHTWNSKLSPDKWSASKWFYMIEEA